MHAPPQAEALAARQLQVWNNLASVSFGSGHVGAGIPALQPGDRRLGAHVYTPRLWSAQAGKQDARSLVKLWPLPEQNDLLQALMYPKFIELRKTLQP